MGSILIITSGTIWGIKSGACLKQRLNELRYIRKIIILMKNYIEYLNMPLNEVFKNMSENLEYPYAQMFENMADKMNDSNNHCETDIFMDNEYCTNSISRIWKDSIIKYLPYTELSKEEGKELLKLGESLGIGNIEALNGIMDMYDEKLGHDIDELSESIKERIKIYSCLGIMGGIFAVIILI